MSLDTDLIDEVATALEAADLPEHNLIRYRRPKGLLPEQCPMLVVWMESKTPSPATTVWFDGIINIGVSWHEAAIEEAETLTMDDDLSRSLLDNFEIIQQAIRDYCLAGSALSAVWQVTPGTVTYLEPRRETGLSEGYACSVVVAVTET